MKAYALLAWRLLDRGLLVGAALLGMTVLLLGGAGTLLFLAYAGLGIAVVTVHDTLGFAAAATISLCAVALGSGGGGPLSILAAMSALLVMFVRRVRR